MIQNTLFWSFLAQKFDCVEPSAVGYLVPTFTPSENCHFASSPRKEGKERTTTTTTAVSEKCNVTSFSLESELREWFNLLLAIVCGLSAIWQAKSPASAVPLNLASSGGSVSGGFDRVGRFGVREKVHFLPASQPGDWHPTVKKKSQCSVSSVG